MNFFKLLSLLSFIRIANAKWMACKMQDNTQNPQNPQNNCVTFSVSSGTGCAWMCNYCATQLKTNNYYFTDNVCTYQQGVGCVGNPYAGVSYTCCSA